MSFFHFDQSGRLIFAGVDAGLAGAADGAAASSCVTGCQAFSSGVTTWSSRFFALYPFCGGSTAMRAMKRRPLRSADDPSARARVAALLVSSGLMPCADSSMARSFPAEIFAASAPIFDTKIRKTVRSDAGLMRAGLRFYGLPNLYPLIDYVNFKGEGTDPAETALDN